MSRSYREVDDGARVEPCGREACDGWNARWMVQENAGPYVVSTVFLIIDHGYDDGPPVLYETMVFPTNPDGTLSSLNEFDSRRYRTRAEAIEGHKAMVEKWRDK